MTANSINYAKQQEEVRHNLAVEVLNTRAQKEVERHNKASEEISIASYQETSRHNRVGESQTYISLTETARHNKRQEDENERHNTAMEIIDLAKTSETQRHNQRMEDLESKSQDIGWYNAYSSRIASKASATSAQASMTSAQASMTSANANMLRAETEYDYQHGKTVMSKYEARVKQNQADYYSALYEKESQQAVDYMYGNDKQRAEAPYWELEAKNEAYRDTVTSVLWPILQLVGPLKTMIGVNNQ